MTQENLYAYPTFIYESNKQYFADCASLNMISAGNSPVEAIDNLKKEINDFLKGKSFIIKPFFEKR